MKNASARQGHILILEDDPGIQEALRLNLELDGYRVRIASNGKQGLEMLAADEERPRLILLDLMMPVMDGWCFAKALEADERFSAIPVVVVSAFSDKPGSIRANAFVTKPVDMDQLLGLIERYAG